MKALYNTIITLTFLSISSIHIRAAEGEAIRIEYENTSLLIELSYSPSLIIEGGHIWVNTKTQLLKIALPCSIYFQGKCSGMEDGITIHNDNQGKPLKVYTIDGYAIGILRKEEDVFSLKQGIYIVNGKKIIVK